MELKKVAIDTEAASKGVWISVGDDAELLIARWDNPEFAKMVRKRVKKYSRLSGDITESKEADRELADLLSKTVLLNWRNLTLGGVPFPYTQENAYKLLFEPEYVEFRDLVVRLSQDASNFRTASVEEAAGNLPSTSAGGQSGESDTLS